MVMGNISVRCDKCGAAYISGDCIRNECTRCETERILSEAIRLKDLQTLQREIGRWSQEQFGNNVSKVTGFPMGSQNALTGIVEEVGELNHVTICRNQGRRGYDDTAKYERDRNDALADILVFMCDYAEREGVDLLTILNDTWNKVVSKRTVANWEDHTHEPSPSPASGIHDDEPFPINPADFYTEISPIEEQTGQGWAEPREEVESLIPKIIPIDRGTDAEQKTCKKCGKKIHRNNLTNHCGDCIPR